ncbi:MAG: SpoIID/LytB domain-containing protein [Flavobacteriales bacterium]|jgi:stage II sporulation protein D|nr:SpoIID/LytB domain-containing protein [Flavobacteriales bacterium]MBK6550902.1 SpoIID/LytB domain-containing protein [Flavobacteriales bacterium]MBK6882460.1 SpoIID/LytB domain-containing protein [Flavobacteriales bacterium]MBK7101329.1 SpoIID/LytB domain-containing protein [Flavobacteriales bacterium]MBK7112036.1 SpoIID/LytB domain-containing protein [Flavobacteriales bacterium]
MRLTAFVCSILFACSLVAQERVVRIGVLRDKTVHAVMVMSAKGPCTVFADGVRKGEILVNDGLRIDVSGRTLSARSLGLTFMAKERIELVPRMETSGLRLRVVDSKMAERTYPGSLVISVKGTAMQLVNAVPLEAYTAGVVQAEAGKDHNGEYYKLQSVSCRTYALCNHRKHVADGFELCDAVHCQVYRGQCKQDSIKKAVEETRGMVLVDPDIKLIHALFHSNCGGETINAEDLWTKQEPYLRSTMDEFCRAAPHATWKRTFTRKEWTSYLVRKFHVRSGDFGAYLNYVPGCRDIYLGNRWPLIPLKQVREDWKLNSTYFTVHTEGEHVNLEGRGFGHGVGLCQEGAMRMAMEGKVYTDILHHYYTDVHLVDLNTLDFFREEGSVPAIAGPRR